MGSAINLDEIKRFEVTEVYTHPDAKVDIVLVHGLNGDPRKTWTAANGCFWPTQLLPATLAQKNVQARILVYGYNADVYTFGSGKGGLSTDMIHQHAQTLLANLSLERKAEDTERNPIIWVAHSLGGILVKRALELSNDLQGKNADDLRSIYVSTYGIIFLGTPHNGSDAAKWGLVLQNMVHALVPKKVFESQSQLIKTLQSNNETLQNINLKFLDIYHNRFQVCMVHESHATDIKGSKVMIVDQLSAGPLLPDVQYFGIEATHSGMCKYESKSAPGYTNVSVTLRSWVMDCPRVVGSYWTLEVAQRRAKNEAQAMSLLNLYTPHPEPTIPDAELPTESQLTNSVSTWGHNTPHPEPTTPHREPSTGIAVALTQQGQLGGGANISDPMHPVNNPTTIISHVDTPPESSDNPDQNTAYFIKPSGFRPNSLFVGRETELADMHKMLFDKRKRAEGTSAVLIQCLPGGGKTHLARQYVYLHREKFPGGVFWLRAKSQAELAAGFWDIARKAALKDKADSSEDSSSPKDSQRFIKTVRKWLNHRHDWLMVLDGIHFGDNDILRNFIPDSPNTSLIYTSTEKAVSGDYHFMNPQIIKLPSLSAREAQKLLLFELDKKEPFNRDDSKYATELVQAMGFLPVVIHAVAQRLKATGEPLSRFARTYSSEPRLRGLGTYMAVVEQLETMKATEALNLIKILSFFSQHIPVEMVSLGMRALDVPIKALEPVNGRNLNNTFKILNSFALMDRNEPDESVQSSQSSKGSQDMLADNVDVIRLHSVVQGFFIDTLASKGFLPEWLNRAVGLFCCSYDMANDRIQRKNHKGLVQDYRLYEIHGVKLREHLVRQLMSKHVHREQKVVLQEAQQMLGQRLEFIKSEIESRTPDSSQIIVEGDETKFQTSIFDRTSSSSDTSGETPGGYDRFSSRVSTWGLEPDRDQHESPASLTNDVDYLRRIEANGNAFRFQPPEDPGYDSDRESVAMTIQPSQRTERQYEPPSPNGSWEEVVYRRPRARPELSPLHRTVRNLGKTRYRDSAGAFRSVTAVDPRLGLSHESAQGSFSDAREQSRGRLSGQSNAVVSLTQITNSSPPPARGGGLIQDKRLTSPRRSSSGRMMPRTPSYAVAVASSTSIPIPGLEEIPRPETEPIMNSRGNQSPLERPHLSAMASLQRFPLEVNRQPPTPRSPQTPILPVLPYPTTPFLKSNSDNEIYEMPGRYSEEGFTLGAEPYQSTAYPRLEGLPPVETTERDIPSRRIPPQAYNGGSLPASMYITHSNLSTYKEDPLSISSPNIQVRREHSHSIPYYPGRPELSNLSENDGYTSQPMTRGPSGQSEHSHHSAQSIGPSGTGLLERRRRRPSVAETEPAPQLPIFSPRIAPTSYQVYERMRERDMLRPDTSRMEGDLEGLSLERPVGGGMQRSPRLAYARAALLDELSERVDADENTPPTITQQSSPPKEEPASPAPPRRQFNPAAPSFSPSPSFKASNSPNLPPVPTNSMFSSQSSTVYPSLDPNMGAIPYTQASSSFRNTSSSQGFTIPSSFLAYPSPLPVNGDSQYQTSPSLQSSTPRTLLPNPTLNTSHSSPKPANVNASLSMERTTSGGVKLPSGRVIEFGDYPEAIRVDEARERVLRSWAKMGREAAERKKRNEKESGLSDQDFVNRQ